MPTDAAPALTVVLVHGLWHGSWSWDDVRARLADEGVESVAPELPMQSLAGDAAVVSEVLDSIDKDVLLVGHSYGGAVVTVAGAHPKVARLVYLAGFLLDDGESISRVAPEQEIAPTALGDALVVSADRGEVSVDPDRAVGLLYNRTDPDVAAAALARVRPVSRTLFSGRPEQLAWPARPSTYVICRDDRTVAPALQEIMAARATTTLSWDSDHSPQASRPADVAALLAGLATMA
ncbi:MAG TPA: alpha/beta hydrolase [Jatrophihabitans sp.]|uniref:alpha/beta hydrolase n=1 Tax=Jatrophihabitans sp. TaxID=1932789 RepID=UPI002E05773D|nr:alpha/beta hydrolase [Jatrophihabitans sp.]